jgi:hypothetical protein
MREPWTCKSPEVANTSSPSLAWTIYDEWGSSGSAQFNIGSSNSW